jgi:hypothetical protein
MFKNIFILTIIALQFYTVQFAQNRKLPQEVRSYIAKKLNKSNNVHNHETYRKMCWGDLNSDGETDLALEIVIQEGDERSDPAKQYLAIFISKGQDLVFVSEKEFVLSGNIPGNLFVTEINAIKNNKIDISAIYWGRNDPESGGSIRKDYHLYLDGNLIVTEGNIKDKIEVIPQIGDYVPFEHFTLCLEDASFKKLDNVFDLTWQNKYLVLNILVTVINILHEKCELNCSMFRVYDLKGNEYYPVIVSDHNKIVPLSENSPILNVEPNVYQKSVILHFSVPEADTTYYLKALFDKNKRQRFNLKG